MEAKKYKSADLSRFRGLFFNIGLVLALGALLVLFEIRFPESSKELSYSGTSSGFEEVMDVPPTEQEIPPPVSQNEMKINIITVPDIEEIEEDIYIQLDIDMTQETKVSKMEYADDIIMEEPAPEETTEEIFTIVEQQPHPVGGYDAFYDYVFENLEYPVRALRFGIEGKVFVEFVVDKDGSIKNPRVVKGISPECDAEAIRVLENAPNWEPGKQRGRPVKVRMVIPITYVILKMDKDTR